MRRRVALAVGLVVLVVVGLILTGAFGTPAAQTNVSCQYGQYGQYQYGQYGTDQYGNCLPPPNCQYGVNQYANCILPPNCQYGIGQYGNCLPPPPAGLSVGVQEERYHVADLSQDAVGAGDSLTGWRGWDGIVNNGNGVALPNPRIELDAASPSWTFTPPAGPFPLVAAQPSLGAYRTFRLEQISGYRYLGSSQPPVSRVEGVAMTSGYGLSRNVTLTTHLDGSATAHVTVTLTPNDARWLGQSLTLGIGVQGPETIDPASVVLPNLALGTYGVPRFSQVSPNFVNFCFANPVLGHSYVLTLDVDFAPGSGDPSTFKPSVNAYGAVSAAAPAPVDATSTQIHDAGLGGSFTYSFGAPVRWFHYVEDAYVVELAYVPPELRTAHARDAMYKVVKRPSTVDDVNATTTFNGSLRWDPSLFNTGNVTLTGAQITLDTSSQTFTPALTFPRTAGPQALGQYSQLDLFDLAGPPVGSEVQGAPITTGFDLTRTVSGPVPAPAGGTVTVTIDLTPRDASFAGGAVFFDASLNDVVPATYVGGSAVWPDASNGEELQTFAVGTSVHALVLNVVIGKTYELRFQANVPNAGPAPLTWRPYVSGAIGRVIPLSPGAHGTSTTIADAAVGGTFTYSTGLDVDWTRDRFEHRSVELAGRADAVVPVDHFKVQVGLAFVGAGQSQPVTVTALDAANNPIPGFVGPVTLSDDTHTLSVVTPLSWTGGVGHGAVRFNAASSGDHVTATDPSTAATGTNPVAFVVVGPLDHFKVTVGLAVVPSGGTQPVTITALDSLNRVVQTFAGPVVLSDTSGVLAGGAVVSWVAGVGQVSVSFTGGSTGDRISATAGAASGMNAVAFVVIGPLDHFKVQVGLAVVPNGGTQPVTVTALDSAGQTVKSFAGPAALSDTSGVLAPGAVLSWSQGVGQVSVSFTGPTASDRITATAAGGATGTNAVAFAVRGPLDHFRVQVGFVLLSVDAAQPVTITAQDAANQTVTSYAGPVTLSDTAGVLLPAAVIVWTNGVGQGMLSFSSPTLSDRITATDGPSGATGTNVNAFSIYGHVDHFKVSVGLAVVQVGWPLPVKAVALDSLGQVVINYAGPVTVTDTAGLIVLGPPFGWTAGTGTGTVGFSAPTTGNHVTVTDPPTGATGTNPVGFDVVP